MPLTLREVLQLSLILLSVPAQLFLTSHMQNASERTQAVFRLIRFKGMKDFKEDWLEWDKWTEWWDSIVTSILEEIAYYHGHRPIKTYSTSDETSPAIEVIEYRENKGYFGMSLQPRKERPYYVRYRVGQVVRHRTLGFRAVIYGWDIEAKAPEHWLKQKYGDSRLLREWPHYALLVDSRDWKSSSTMYVVQEQLELLKSTEIRHPNIGEHFQYFDGAQYIPKKKLRSLYPKD